MYYYLSSHSSRLSDISEQLVSIPFPGSSFLNPSNFCFHQERTRFKTVGPWRSKEQDRETKPVEKKEWDFPPVRKKWEDNKTSLYKKADCGIWLNWLVIFPKTWDNKPQNSAPASSQSLFCVREKCTRQKIPLSATKVSLQREMATLWINVFTA